MIKLRVIGPQARVDAFSYVGIFLITCSAFANHILWEKLFYQASVPDGAGAGISLQQENSACGLNQTGRLLDYLECSLSSTCIVIAVSFLVLATYFAMFRKLLGLDAGTSMMTVFLISFTKHYLPFDLGTSSVPQLINNLVFVVAVWCCIEESLAIFWLVIAIGVINSWLPLYMAIFPFVLSFVRERRVSYRSFIKNISVSATLLVSGILLRSHFPIGVDSKPFVVGGAQLTLSNLCYALTFFGFILVISCFGLYRSYCDGGPRGKVLVALAILLIGCGLGRVLLAEVPDIVIMCAPVVFIAVAIELSNWCEYALCGRIMLMVIYVLAQSIGLNDFSLSLNALGALIFLIVWFWPRLAATQHDPPGRNGLQAESCPP